MKKKCGMLALLLAASMMLSVLPLTARAVSVGDSFAPDLNTWGVQNNNGWYFLYRDAGGGYHEMNYYDATSSISWQRNAFASNPDVDNEMYFISKTEIFVGENGTLPAYAFRAPEKGQIELSFETHGLEDMRVSVYCMAQHLKTITTNTSGPNAGFTTQTVRANVNPGDMVYIVVSTTGAARQVWMHDVKAAYVTVGTHPPLDAEEDPNPSQPSTEEVPDPPTAPAPAAGVRYTPSQSAWGAQNNNHWYYMYLDPAGRYEQLTYYTSQAPIAWQKKAFAFDPNVMNEMLFINAGSCFTGESGSRPVYAFQCPSGGTVELSLLSHGSADMQVEILKNGESLKKYSLNTTGSEAGFTKTVVQTGVKKDTWLYIVVSSAGAEREAWIKDLCVQYLSVNGEVEQPPEPPATEPAPETPTYVPTMENWGKQNNNGWYYLSKGSDNVYREMPWYGSNAAIDWQKNSFASDPDAAQEMYFISRQKFFVGELGTMPVYGFLCPSGGTVELTVSTHGESSVSMTVLKNRERIDSFRLSKKGSSGEYTLRTYKIEVKKGTWLYLEGSTSGDAREGYVNAYSVRYLSKNDQEETSGDGMTGKVFTPDRNLLRQDNNGWYYMYYDRLLQRYAPMTKYDSTAPIEWQRNAFAIDPSTMFEMLFMTNDHYFIGENGTCPVYAFRCPSGGDVLVKTRTHGREDMYMKVFHNGTEVNSYTYTTTGAYNGFTEHVDALSVKKDDWIYLVCGSNGEDRDGWISFLGVEYLSENASVGGYTHNEILTPDTADAWGSQNNHGWSFQYLDKNDNLFRKLAYIRADEIFAGTSEGGYEYLLIKRLEMHPAVKADPAKVFTCEKGGNVELSFQAWMQAPHLSPTGTGIAVYHNGVKIWPEDEPWHKLGGEMETIRLNVDVAAGDDLAIVLDALEQNNSFDATNVRVCARYLSFNESVRTVWPEYPEETAPAIVQPTQPEPTGSTTPTAGGNAPEPGTTANSGKIWLWVGLGVSIAVAGGAAAALILDMRRKKKA